MPGAHKPNEGYLFADGIYTVEGVRRAIGFGRNELANARRTGVVRPVLVGKRRIYLGRELIQYVESLQKQQYDDRV